MSWQQRKVGDLCKVGRGSSPRPKGDPRYFENGTIPWVKVADATASGKYLYETKETVNQFGSTFSRLLPAGSLIICTSGTLARPSRPERLDFQLCEYCMAKLGGLQYMKE